MAGPTDYAQEVADAIIEQLRAGTAPWMKPWEAGVGEFTPHNPTTGKPYRGANALWLMVRAETRGYSDTRWMTYRQAAARDAQVLRGEKGTRIQYWMWEGDEPVRDGHGRPKRNAKGELITERVRYERPRVFTATVFNAQQMEGFPPMAPRPVAPEWERHARAEDLLRASGAAIEHIAGDRAAYNPVTDRVILPERTQFRSADRYYGTALHEVGHWTGHPSRLARDLAHPFGSPGYAREELRAEIASLMLGAELGIGHDPSRHASYVQSWIRALQEDPRESFRAASDAEKIRTFLLGIERVRDIDAVASEGAPVMGVVLGRAHARDPDAAAPSADAPVLVESPGVDVPTRDPQRGAHEGSRRDMSPDDTGSTTATRRYFHVPFAEREAVKAAAKSAGTWVRWERASRSWYIAADADPAPFQRWIAGRTSVVPDPVSEFAAALEAAGLRLTEAPLMDGALHRVGVEGDARGEKSGAYKAHLDGRPAGYIENFKTGFKETWKTSAPLEQVSPADRAQMLAAAAERRAAREQEREKLYEAAARSAVARWEEAAPLASAGAATHPYLQAKQVPDLACLRVDGSGRLLIPVTDIDGRLQTLQVIRPDGSKRFEKNGKLAGGMLVLNPGASVPTPAAAIRQRAILITEGYSTGATVARATECTTIVAFNAGNLEAVATAVRARFPDAAIIIAADNDEAAVTKKRPNVGRVKAEQAARAVGGHVLLPEFPTLDALVQSPASGAMVDERGRGGARGSDWNDLERAAGADHVRVRLLAGLDDAVRSVAARTTAEPALAVSSGVPHRAGPERAL